MVPFAFNLFKISVEFFIDQKLIKKTLKNILSFPTRTANVVVYLLLGALPMTAGGKETAGLISRRGN